MATPLFQIVAPVTELNYGLNSSFEDVTSGTTLRNVTATGGTIVRDTTQVRFGRYSGKYVASANNQSFSFTTATLPASNMRNSLWFYGTTNAPEFSHDNSTWTASTLIETDGSWKRYRVSLTSAQVSGRTLTYVRLKDGAGTFYVDGFLLHVDSYSADLTYFDAQPWQDDDHFYPVGTLWQSAHYCFATSPSTGEVNVGCGKIIDLDDSATVIVNKMSGIGTAPVEHLTTTRQAVPGTVYYSSSLGERAITLTTLIVGDRTATNARRSLHTKFFTLVETLQLLSRFRLRYLGANTAAGSRTLEIDCAYVGNMDFDNVVGHVGRVAIQLTAFDPRWRYAYDTLTTLTTLSASIASDYAVARVRGTWGRLSTGPGGPVRSMCVGPDGTVYVAVFSGTVKSWNGTAWTTLGTFTGGAPEVWCIDIATDGSALFVGGNFTTVNPGAVTVANIAKYTFSTGAWTVMGAGLGTGGTDVVYSLCCTKDGLYVVATGNFTTTYTRIARWSIAGGAWSVMGTGATSTPYKAIAAPNGDVFVGGDHATVGTVTSPSISSVTAGGGGSLTAGTYSFRIIALTGTGMAASGATSSGTTSGGNLKLTVTWSAATGATGYIIIRGAAGVSNNMSFLATTTATSYIDDGTVARDTNRNYYASSVDTYTPNDGSRSANVARWSKIDGAWYSVGNTGFNGRVWGLALAPNGMTLYACGDFTTAEGATCTRAAILVGLLWSPMGAGTSEGLNSTGFSVVIGPDGRAYFAGGFTTAGGNTLCVYIAVWTGYENGQWLPMDLTPAQSLYGIAWRGNDLYVGATTSTGTYTASVGATITATSNLDNNVTVEMYGAMDLRMLSNYTKARTIYGVPLNVGSGELTRLITDPLGPRITSITRGRRTDQIEAASDLGSFVIGRGANTIYVYATNTDGNAAIVFRERPVFSSIDAASQ